MSRYEELIANKTPYARRYGYRPLNDTEGLFNDAIHSGFTPTKRACFAPLRDHEKIHNEKIDRFQRNNTLHGFSANELVEMGVYPDPDIILTALENPIHPIYQFEQWEGFEDRKVNIPVVASGPEYSFGNQELGFWVASNEIVWNLLDPVLRLASRILDDAHTCPLLDAFYSNSTWERIEPNDDPRSRDKIDKYGLLWKFSSRPAHQQNDPASIARKKKYHELIKAKLRLKIGSGVKGMNNERSRSIPAIGLTSCNRHENFTGPATSVTVQIGYEQLQKLLKNDLSPCERLLVQFAAAMTLAHETMLALVRCVAYEFEDDAPWHNYTKPIFSPQITSELGFALEIDLCGGVMHYIPSISPNDTSIGNPYLCAFIISHPSPYYFNWPKEIILGGPEQAEKYSQKPIRMKHFEIVQNEGFCDTAVRKWGLQMLRPGEGESCLVSNEEWWSGTSGQDEVWRHDYDLNWQGQTVQQLNAMGSEDVQSYLRVMKIDRQKHILENRRQSRRRRGRNGEQAKALFGSLTRNHVGRVQGALEHDHVKLMLTIHDEASAHLNDAARFMSAPFTDWNDPSEPYDSESHKYLRDSNRELRNLMVDIENIFEAWLIPERVVNPVADCLDVKQEIHSLKVSLYTSFFLLNSRREDLEPYKHLSDQELVDNAKIHTEFHLSDIMAQSQAWDAENCNSRTQRHFIPNILQEAKISIINGDIAKAEILAVEIIDAFAWVPDAGVFMRGVATCLMAWADGKRGGGMRAKLVRDMEIIIGDNMSDNIEDVDEDMRRWWESVWNQFRAASRAGL